jgi:hypothetical protein
MIKKIISVGKNFYDDHLNHLFKKNQLFLLKKIPIYNINVSQYTYIIK